MGARRHGQGGGQVPRRKYCKVFCALVVTVKRSVDHALFSQFLSASVGFAPRPTDLKVIVVVVQRPPELHPWIPLGDFCLQIP